MDRRPVDPNPEPDPLSPYLPQRNPMPVGPHILCADATSQSAPSARTSTGMLGTLWQASTSSLPPTCRSARQMRR